MKRLKRRFYTTGTMTVSDGYSSSEIEALVPAPKSEALLVSSQLADSKLHAPLLDLDVPHRLIPSSTAGHGHLYIDVPMTWRKYKRLLRALRRAGIIEEDYYQLARARRASVVRKPGVEKQPWPLALR